MTATISSSKTKKIAAISTFVVIALGLAIGLSLAFVKSGYDSNDSNNSKSKVIFQNVDASSYKTLIRGANRTTAQIPKKIWTFWDKDQLPPFIHDCIGGWKEHNPDFEINIITPSNIKKYTTRDIPEILFTVVKSIYPAHVSDWVRLAILSEHGGVWMDASVVFTQSLSYILQKQQETGVENYMFYQSCHTNYESTPHLESYAFASVPNSPMIQAWFKEFDSTMRDFVSGSNKDYKVMLQKYLDKVKQDVGDRKFKQLEDGVYDPLYLKVYISLKKTLMNDNGLSSYYAVAAESNPLGIPQIVCDWNPDAFVEAMLVSPPAGYVVPPMIKIIKSHREGLLKALDEKRSFSPNSIYARFIENKRIHFKI